MAKKDDGVLVLTVPEAGALLGLGRNASYEAAARGDLPVVRFGKLMRVPKVALDRILNEAGRTNEKVA
jgi:excisionase family DNA binding protein